MPPINRFRVVDLLPEASLVGSLRRRGIPVYLVDWGAPRRIDSRLDFEDYVLRLLPRAAASVPAGERLDVVGLCLGGTLAALFAARFPASVRRLVTINAPIDFGRDEPHLDLLRLWVRPEHFPVERLTGAFGNMPGGLIQQGFLWQRPVLQALKYLHAWERFGERSFADLFCALESWSNDGVDVPGAAYRRLIRDLYRENRLARGRFTLGGRPVDLRRITCPVLVVASKSDTICPPAAARALLDLVGSEEKTTLEVPGGHVAPFAGRRSERTLYAPLADWLLSGGSRGR
jgi:polyhydroxyalkanoate synthase